MKTDNIRVLIAAAGRGTRAGLPYPKTLFSIKGQPILVHILRLLSEFDSCPAIIVSPEGEGIIRDELNKQELTAELIVQAIPKGMGDAVLCIEHSQNVPTEHILLIWGDIPFIQPKTVMELVTCHLQNNNDMTFVTRVVDQAYTVVRRDETGKVLDLEETRETGNPLAKGERDIGLFIFRRAPVLEILKEEVVEKFGKYTSEHGFLYVVRQLVKQNLKVEALPIATELDLISLNKLSDIEALLEEV